MAFLVADFKRAKLRVFLFRRPAQTTPSKPDDADDDQNNSDEAKRGHQTRIYSGRRP